MSDLQNSFSIPPTHLVDIAGNLTNKAFRDDIEECLDRAAENHVGAIVVAGVNEMTSRRGLEMCRHRRDAKRGAPALVATSGFHPHHASDASPAGLKAIAELAETELAVAVGECGLDYNRDFSPREIQRRAFEAQLEIASQVKKPVYLHERDAHDDFAAILERWRSKISGGVVHCFTGDGNALARYLAMDMHIGITGWICDERRGVHLRELVRTIPRGRLMIETDAPYILPRDMPARPKDGRNEPAFVRHVAMTVAKCRGETYEELATHTTATARALFGF